METSCEAIISFDSANHAKFRQVLSDHKQLDKVRYRKTKTTERSPSVSPCPSPTTEHHTHTSTNHCPRKSADHITYSQPRIICLQLPPWEVEADEAAVDKENQAISPSTNRRVSTHRRESVPLGSLEPIQYATNNDVPDQSFKLHLESKNDFDVDDEQQASPMTPKSRLVTSTPTSASSTGGNDSTNRKRFKQQIKGLANGRALVSSLKNISTGAWREGSGQSKRIMLREDEDSEDVLSSPVQRMTLSGGSPSLKDNDIPDSPIASSHPSSSVKRDYSLPEIQLSNDSFF